MQLIQEVLCGCLSCQNRDNLRVFIKTPFEIWPEETMVQCQISHWFDPSLWLNQLGVDPHFYSAFRKVSLGNQARKQFLGPEEVEVKAWTGESISCSTLVSFLSIPGQNVNKFVVLWDRLEQPNVLGWKGLRVGKESPLPSQAKLGKLSLDFPVLGGYHPADIPTRLELDGRGVAWPASAGPLEAWEMGKYVVGSPLNSNPGGTNQRKPLDIFNAFLICPWTSLRWWWG